MTRNFPRGRNTDIIDPATGSTHVSGNRDDATADETVDLREDPAWGRTPPAGD